VIGIQKTQQIKRPQPVNTIMTGAEKKKEKTGTRATLYR
jgi:hypothetical protein